MVNRLALGAARRAGIDAAIVALHDHPDAGWRRDWPRAVCAQGSRLGFALGALAYRRHARGAVIFVTHIGLAPVARGVHLVAGGRVRIFLHGVEAWRRLPRLTAWGAAAAERVVTNSMVTLTRFREANPDLSGIPGQVCHLPARFEDVADGRAPTPGPHVLIVGRLEGRGLVKGQRPLIGLWPRVLARFPGAELWIVGQGEGRAALERLAHETGVADAVRFPVAETDDDLSGLYARATLFAMPSQGEGFGLVFAEAMAHGLACIASRTDAGAEVVADGETGLLVDPEDLEELFRALCRLLGDAALRTAMGDRGRRRAAELFSLASFEQRIVELLQPGAGPPEDRRR